MESIITSIKELSDRQFKIIDEERKHNDAMKNYFIHHTQGSLELIKDRYETLQEFIIDLTSKKSEEKTRSIIKMCEQFSSYIFPFTNDQLQIASSSLSPWVAHKFIDIFAGIGSTFGSIKQNPKMLDNDSDLQHINESIEYQIQSINECID
jgi:hypothetical protein